MIYFTTRTLARTFSQKADKYKVTDTGKNKDVGRRWGVKVL